jgi:hypothetical protein
MAPTQTSASAALEGFIETLSALAFGPLSEQDRQSLLRLRPLFDLAPPEGGLYCHALKTAAELDPALVRDELALVLGEPVARVVFASNAGTDRPWNVDLPARVSDGRLFAHAITASRNRRTYRKGCSKGDLARMEDAHERALGFLSSNLRGTFTDGLEDEVWQGIDDLIEALVLAILVGDTASRDRYARFLPTLLTCAPLAESHVEPGAWFVFVR